jgi:phosphatidylinositol alpha 1,6-mannosyltransferase
VWTLELPRGFLSFALEKDLRFDPAFLRHIPLIGEVLERFKPDLIHITGPSEVGMLGAGLAHHMSLPLAASWHTNVHEYAGAALGLVPAPAAGAPLGATGQKIEDLTMAIAARFYSVAQVLFAPNPELCALLERTTGRPCHLMPRGVDAELFIRTSASATRRSRVCAGLCGPALGREEHRAAGQVQEELEKMGTRTSASSSSATAATRPGCASGCRARSLPEC